MSQNQLTTGMGAGEMIVDDVSKGFGLGPLHKQVLCNCSFTLEKRKLTVLIGPSGCGKSTLVNVLAGYETPDCGTIQIDGQPINGPGVDRLVVFQETALFPWMTTFENVCYGPKVQRKLSKDVYEVVSKSLV